MISIFDNKHVECVSHCMIILSIDERFREDGLSQQKLAYAWTLELIFFGRAYSDAHEVSVDDELDATDDLGMTTISRSSLD